MSDMIKKFADVAANPQKWLKQWKEKTGKKIVGCFPMYIPEEIVHAAGMLPIVMLPRTEEISMGDTYMHRYLCHPVRANFDMMLKEEYDYLDGVVFSDYCITLRSAMDVWALHNKNCFFIHFFVPLNMSASYSRRYLEEQFVRLKEKLEEQTGEIIEDSAIMESMRIYEENRELLRELYDFRKENPGFLRARDYVIIIAAGMVMPKEEHSLLLKELLQKLKGSVQVSRDKQKIKLFISGSLCEVPMLDLFDMVEDLGAVVCDDDLYVGSRYFKTPVKFNKAPITALAERYMGDVPCPTKRQAGVDYGEYIANCAREANAEGIIIIVLKYCEAHQWDIPLIRESVGEKKMPYLVIESTGGMIATEQLRTRMQAFIEMLEERRNF